MFMQMLSSRSHVHLRRCFRICTLPRVKQQLQLRTPPRSGGRLHNSLLRMVPAATSYDKKARMKAEEKVYTAPFAESLLKFNECE